MLYVDTLSAPMAESNVKGISRAYERAGVVLEAFDYRAEAERYGFALMNRLLQRVALSFRPHLVHLGKSESVSGATVRKIKLATGARVIHVYGDLRWELQRDVVEIGREADFTLFQHSDARLSLPYAEQGVVGIGHWRAGADTAIFFPRPVAKKYDIAFMANNPEHPTIPGADERRALVRAIAAAGFDLHIFGEGWDELGHVQHLRLHPFVSESDFAEACSAAKITLGCGTDGAYLYTSWPRPLKSMASGAFHLTRYFPGLETVFANGDHLVWFRSTEEAVELIRFYLRNDVERERIAVSGRREVARHHTWDHRVRELLALVGSAPAAYSTSGSGARP